MRDWLCSAAAVYAALRVDSPTLLRPPLFVLDAQPRSELDRLRRQLLAEERQPAPAVQPSPPLVPRQPRPLQFRAEAVGLLSRSPRLGLRHVTATFEFPYPVSQRTHLALQFTRPARPFVGSLPRLAQRSLVRCSDTLQQGLDTVRSNVRTSSPTTFTVSPHVPCPVRHWQDQWSSC